MLTALAIGAVFGVTAWSLYSREPGLLTVQGKPMQEETLPSPVERQLKIDAGSTADGTDTAGNAGQKGRTEKMIDAGQLSRHPARFFNKERP